MNAADLITIGVVTAPHGVRGEVRVKIETDFPERFTDATHLTFALPSSTGEKGGASTTLEIEVEEARPHRGMILLKLAGHDDREAAERLRGARVVIARSEVRPLPEGTWYIFDLEGLEVYTREGNHLGVLAEVLHPGGNDVYVVKKDGRELLLPAIKQVILEVDLERRRMTVDPLEEYEETP